MGEKSAIEWTDASWTPIRARNKATGKVGWHCVHASPGCQFCYAEGLNKRLGTGLPFKPGHEKDIEIFLDEEMLLAPLRWKRPRMIFVCSMTDLFADFVPDEMIDKLFAVMALAPQHTFQVLTKRSKRMRAYMAECDGSQEWDGSAFLTAWPRRMGVANAMGEISFAMNYDVQLGRVHVLPLPNVWLGVSAEDQPRADERIPDLLASPAALRFVSAEPLLGPIDFTTICDGHSFFDALAGIRYHDAPEGGATARVPKVDQIITGNEFRPEGPRCAARLVPIYPRPMRLGGNGLLPQAERRVHRRRRMARRPRAERCDRDRRDLPRPRSAEAPDVRTGRAARRGLRPVLRAPIRRLDPHPRRQAPRRPPARRRRAQRLPGAAPMTAISTSLVFMLGVFFGIIALGGSIGYREACQLTGHVPNPRHAGHPLSLPILLAALVCAAVLLGSWTLYADHAPSCDGVERSAVPEPQR